MRSLLGFCMLVSLGSLASKLCTNGSQGESEQVSPKPVSKLIIPNGTPEQQVKSLIAQFDAAMSECVKLMEKAKTPEEEFKIRSELVPPNPQDYAALLLRIAEENPKDPAAVDALIWASGTGGSAKAKALLVRDHLQHPKIAGFCIQQWGQWKDLESASILRSVLDKNPDKGAQAHAAYALAVLLGRQAKMVRVLQKVGTEESKNLELALKKEVADSFKRADPAAMEKEAEDLYERIIADKAYASTNCVISDEDIKLKMGDMADRQLFQIRHLQPGKPAPEIKGEDLDGKEFKLSDYRGKVVLLEFSGHWCVPCRALYPLGRSLVERYKERPFAIVGVSSDAKRETIKEVMVKEKLTWRSFWDGGSPLGPIHRMWNVGTWPTMYLIDHNGVIVGNIRGLAPEEEVLVEKKVKEAEGKGKK